MPAQLPLRHVHAFARNSYIRAFKQDDLEPPLDCAQHPDQQFLPPGVLRPDYFREIAAVVEAAAGAQNLMLMSANCHEHGLDLPAIRNRRGRKGALGDYLRPRFLSPSDRSVWAEHTRLPSPRNPTHAGRVTANESLSSLCYSPDPPGPA